MKRFALAFLAAVLAFPSQAQQLNVTDISKLVGTSTAQIGTTAVLVVPVMGSAYPGVPIAWDTLFIANASGTATISCGYSSAITVNGADTFTITPQGSQFWPPGTVPKNLPVWCVASAAATPVQAVVGTP